MDYIKSCAHLTAGVFKQRKEDVTLKYTTPVSPALWALFLWDYTYFWIFAMFVYLLVGLCRRLAPAPFATYSHIHNKIILNKPHPSAELYPSLMLLSPFLAWLHANKSLHLVQRQFILSQCSRFFFASGRLLLLNMTISPEAQCVCISLTKPNNIIFAPDRNAYDWMYTTPALLPYGFHVSIIINACLNITWLLLFDRE